MALINLDIIPGIDKQNTTKGAERRWIDSDNVRFRYGLPEKVGGWSSLVDKSIVGVVRAQHPFLDKDGKRGDKVDSVANRLVYFPNTVRHAGTTTTNEKARYVVNINYIPRYKCPFHEFLGKEFMLN